MIIIRVCADSITATYKDSNEYDFVESGYHLLGKNYTYSWIANPEGKICGAEFYLPPESEVSLHLQRLLVALKAAITPEFLAVYFAATQCPESLMNCDFGDYYFYSPSVDRMIIFLPSELSAADLFLTNS